MNQETHKNSRGDLEATEFQSPLLKSIHTPIKLTKKMRKEWLKVLEKFPSQLSIETAMKEYSLQNSLLLNLSAEQYQSWLSFCTVLVESSLLNEAEECIKQALKIKPEKTDEIWGFLGQLYYNNQQFDRALQAFETALLSASKANEFNLWNNLGIVYKRVQSYDKAESAFNKALSLQEDDSGCWMNLANFYFERKRFEEAETAYHRAISLEDNNATTFFNYGKFLLARNRLPAARKTLEKALSLHPSFLPTHFLLATAYRRLGLFDKAKKVFYDLSRSDPANPQVWYHYGVLLYELSLFENARLALTEAVKLAPSMENIVALSAIYFEQNQLSQIDDLLKRILSGDSDSSSFWFLLGEFYVLRGNFFPAIKIYRQILATDTESIIAWNQLGIALLYAQQFEEARKAFEEVLKRDPNDFDAIGNLVNIQISLKQYSEAEVLTKASIDKLQRLEIPQPSIEAKAWLRLGEVYFQTQNFLGAENGYKQAHKLDPTLFSPLVSLSNLYIQMARFTDAETYAQKALDLNPGDLQTWMNFGLIYRFTERFEEAEKSYRKVLEIDETSAQGWMNLGDCLIQMGRFREAESTLKRSIDLQANYFLAWANLLALLKKLGREEEVEKHVHVLIQKHTNDPETLNDLGSKFLNSMLIDSAILCFDSVIQNHSNSVDAYIGLSYAYGKKQEHDKALNALRQASQIDPKKANPLRGEARVFLTLTSQKWKRLMSKPISQKNFLKEVKMRYESLIKDFWPSDKPPDPHVEFMGAVNFFFKSRNFMIVQLIPEHIAKRGKEYMINYYTKPNAPPIPKFGITNVAGKEYRFQGRTIDNLNQANTLFTMLHKYEEALKAMNEALSDPDYPPAYEDYLIKVLSEIMLDKKSALETIAKMNKLFPNHVKGLVLGLIQFKS